MVSGMQKPAGLKGSEEEAGFRKTYIPINKLALYASFMYK